MRRDDFELPQPPRLDRPLDDWVCGHYDRGHPCAHGPSPDGSCPAIGDCQPVSKPDGTYQCARPACAGGRCDQGPTTDGQCGCQPQPCIPRRTWHARHRRMLFVGAAAAIAAICVAVSLGDRSAVLKPGPLTQAHARILSQHAGSDRCAACHPAAKGSLASWFLPLESDHPAVTQTQLCVDCHGATLPAAEATHAHNLTTVELASFRSQARSRDTGGPVWLATPAFPMEDVQCSSCHREHHGALIDLTAMTNHQCQSCHQDRFHSFAEDHPDWTAWPYDRPRRIAFDHASHAKKHYPTAGPGGTAEAFDCRQCHRRTVDGNWSRAVAYEDGCARCHDQSLQLESSEGFELLAVPALIRPPRIVGRWPQEVSGYNDGRIGPLTRLLLAADPKAARALPFLPDGYDLARVQADDEKQNAAARVVSRAIVRLMDAVATQGAPAIERRLVEQSIAPESARQLAAHLSPQFVASTRQRWFAAAPDSKTVSSTSPTPHVQQVQYETFGGGSLLDEGDEPGGDDPLRAPAIDSVPANDLSFEPPLNDSPEPAAAVLDEPSAKERFDPAEMLAAGGWFRDDLRLAIRYRGAGHADPLLVALYDIANSLPRGHQAAADLKQLPAIVACVRCHQHAEPRAPSSWTAVEGPRPRPQFTKFTHRAHMNLPELRTCTHCHALGDGSAKVTPVSNAAVSRADFTPLTRATCAGCHTPEAAGDQCTKCHRYHVNPPPAGTFFPGP